MYLIQKQTFFANKTQFQSANWRRIKQTTVQIIDWFIGGGRTNVFLLNFEIMHEKKKFIQKFIFWESEKLKKNSSMRRNATVGYFLKASLTKVSRKSIFKFPSAKWFIAYYITKTPTKYFGTENRWKSHLLKNRVIQKVSQLSKYTGRCLSLVMTWCQWSLNQISSMTNS